MPLPSNMLDARCRMCGKREVSMLGDVPPTHPAAFHTQEFRLLHCNGCDVVYLDPLPTAADLKLLYEDGVQFDDPHYTDPVRVAQVLDYCGTAVRSLHLLQEGGNRILEIGAGLAWISRACKAADPAVVTVAQDVSGEAAQACPWVDRYFVGPLDALPDRGPFQLISLTHVFEHIVDPAAMLDSIATLLAPGGKVFITAPFRPSGWQPGQGVAAWRDYSYLHVPAHITYFSRRWFEEHGPPSLEIAHWDATHEDGQAFALVLHKK
jgi:SAM-dependent methyltransferase